jgi:hypothetical protein
VFTAWLRQIPFSRAPGTVSSFAVARDDFRSRFALLPQDLSKQE